MHIVSISTDRNMCDEDSAVAQRQSLYGACFERTDIIMLSTRNHACSDGMLENNVHIHTTSSAGKWAYIFDASRIARTLTKPDVVVVQDPFETGLIGLRIAKIWNVPLYVQVHTDLYAPGYFFGHPINMLRRLVAPSVLMRAKRIRVVGERIKKGIQEAINARVPITVLPIFVDLKRYRAIVHQLHPTFSPSLVVVGRLESEKNARLAIDTLAELRARGHEKAGLTVVGSGRQLEPLRARARAQEVEAWVRFAGAKDPINEYAQADVVLVPSVYEGYNMVAIEALAAGIPVVATDVGIAKEAGAFISEPTAKSFANAIEQLPKKKGKLSLKTYRNEDEYVKKYCEDIRACIH